MGYIEVQFSDHSHCLLHEYYDCDETIKKLVDDIEKKGMELRLKMFGKSYIDLIKQYFNEDDRIMRIMFKTDNYEVWVLNEDATYDLDDEDLETISDMFGI